MYQLSIQSCISNNYTINFHFLKLSIKNHNDSESKTWELIHIVMNDKHPPNTNYL